MAPPGPAASVLATVVAVYFATLSKQAAESGFVSLWPETTTPPPLSLTDLTEVGPGTTTTTSTPGWSDCPPVVCPEFVCVEPVLAAVCEPVDSSSLYSRWTAGVALAASVFSFCAGRFSKRPEVVVRAARPVKREAVQQSRF